MMTAEQELTAEEVEAIARIDALLNGFFGDPQLSRLDVLDGLNNPAQ